MKAWIWFKWLFGFHDWAYARSIGTQQEYRRCRECGKYEHMKEYRLRSWE